MGTPQGWPERPAFGRFRMVTVEKPDGRRVEYYDWPGETDGDDPADRDVSDRDAAPGRKAVGGV